MVTAQDQEIKKFCTSVAALEGCLLPNRNLVDNKYEMLFSVGAEAQILLDHLIKVFSQEDF